MNWKRAGLKTACSGSDWGGFCRSESIDGSMVACNAPTTSIPRQHHRKRRAVTNIRRDGDASAVGIHHFLDDEQPQAKAGGRVVRAGIVAGTAHQRVEN